MSTQDFIQQKLANLTNQPGVYRMLDSENTILYVGKARQLKKRVTSYFRKQVDSVKTKALVSRITDFKVTVTNTEAEALILEQNLIKKHRPRFNVLLRDDKSYPYIYLSTDRFPRLSLHRGAKRGKGSYFGPFPSVVAAKDSLQLLQKLFQVRQCTNSYFKHRSRPCLQYQIKRCKAPCVGLVSDEDYSNDVELTRLFYQGKNESVIDVLMKRMDEASEKLDFEQAAQHRDQISRMRDIMQRQVVESSSGDIDVFGLARNDNTACIFVLFIRRGMVLGDQRYYQSLPQDLTDSELMTTFLGQYYLDSSQLPAEILVKVTPSDRVLLSKAIKFQTRQSIKIGNAPREKRANWLQLATTNALNALESRVSSEQTQTSRLNALKQLIGLEHINRMECFDISHTSGENTVASCVVFGPEGPVKSLYRLFNIKGITKADDFAAMRQVLERRYKRVKSGELSVPDVLIIDGGKGQLRQAEEVLEALAVDIPCVLGIAKGRTRKAGLEQIIVPGTATPLMLEASDPALHLLQHIRDESHRFAISGHRNQRAKQKRTSTLETIPGIGAAKRRELLRRFGGLEGVRKASAGDLRTVKGISAELAQRIYDYLHED